MEQVIAALPGIISAVSIGIVGWFARGLVGFKHDHDESSELAHENRASIDGITESVSEIRSMVDIIMEAQRNQIKETILAKYYECQKRGYITPMELEAVNRLADSYFKCGGNSYIHAIMRRINRDLPVIGDPIPKIGKNELEGEEHEEA